MHAGLHGTRTTPSYAIARPERVRQMRQAMAIATVETLQSPYSLLKLDVEPEILPLRARTQHRRDCVLSVESLRQMGQRYRRSVGEVAIAWTPQKPAVTGAIVGGRSASRETRFHVPSENGSIFSWGVRTNGSAHGEKARSVYATLRTYAQDTGSRALEGMALSRLAVVAREQSWDLYTAQTLAAEAVRVVESTGDAAVIAETHWALGQIATLANDLDVARPHARRALELARSANLRVLTARSLLLVAQTAQVWGERDDIVAAAEEGRTRFRDLADEVERTEAPRRMPQPASSGRPSTRSATDRHEHVKPPQLLWAGSPPETASGYRTLEAHCLSTACCGKICRGEPEEGVHDGRMALHLARKVNNAQMYAMGSYVIVPGLIEIGAYQEALDITRQGFEDARVNGDAFSLMATRLALGHTMHALYQPDEAYVQLHEAAALAEKIPARHWQFRPWAQLCVNRALAGDWTAAAAAAARAITLRDAAQVRLVYYDFARHYEIEALLRTGDSARAHADVQRMSERVRPERQDQRYHLVSLRMRAVLARFDGQVPQAIALLQEALRLAEYIRLPGEQCQFRKNLAYLVDLDPEHDAEAEALRMRSQILASTLAKGVADAELRSRLLHVTQDAYFVHVRPAD